MATSEARAPLSVAEIREKALRLNNPQVPPELRQRALGSLLVELCDRFTEWQTAAQRTIGETTRTVLSKLKELDEQAATFLAMAQDASATAANAAQAQAAPVQQADGMPVLGGIDVQPVGGGGGGGGGGEVLAATVQTSVVSS